MDSFPSSFKVSTVILTEVAVKTIPINILCTVLLTFTISSFLNISATANPPKSGIITPNEAIINDAFPLSLSSSILLSKPAVNMSTITPWLINSVSFKILNIAGPSIKPASNAPTTCGRLNPLVSNDKHFVLNNISAMSNKYLYDIIPPP